MMKNKNIDEKSIITYNDAIKMLPDEEMIHTFINPSGGISIGASWKKSEILKALKEAKKIEETGKIAQSMNHGIAIIDEGSLLFIETKRSG